MGLRHVDMFALAADLVVFALEDTRLKILLIRRGNSPFKGHWALPGGFLEKGETLEQCAERELAEETGIELRHLKPLGTFSKPGRDPRGDVISVAYMALVRTDGLTVTAGSDAREAAWVPMDKLPKLAFDHAKIIDTARTRLTDDLYQSQAVFSLLPDSFTLAEAQSVFEQIIGEPLDKRNFRSWLHKEGILQETGEERRGAHRPAKLYSLEEGGL